MGPELGVEPLAQAGEVKIRERPGPLGSTQAQDEVVERPDIGEAAGHVGRDGGVDHAHRARTDAAESPLQLCRIAAGDDHIGPPRGE